MSSAKTQSNAFLGRERKAKEEEVAIWTRSYFGPGDEENKRVFVDNINIVTSFWACEEENIVLKEVKTTTVFSCLIAEAFESEGKNNSVWREKYAKIRR